MVSDVGDTDDSNDNDTEDIDADVVSNVDDIDESNDNIIGIDGKAIDEVSYVDNSDNE